MRRVKGELLMALYALTILGAHRGPINISTRRLGGILGVSQQTASRRLMELEAHGLVRRRVTGRGTYVMLTAKGLETLREVYVNLSKVFRGAYPRVFKIRGIVFTGLGEGAYYTNIPKYRRAFEELLGGRIYPGTLNLRIVDELSLSVRRELKSSRGTIIPAFKSGARTFGSVRCFKASIDNIPCLALIIERTHYGDDVIEIVSTVNLRKTLRLRDGSIVEVTIYSNGNEKES